VAIAIACIYGNPGMSEWKTTLSSPQQAIRQSIVLPPLDQNHPAGSVCLLIDLAQGQCPAPLDLSLNGVEFKVTARPWWQIQPNTGFLDVLALQARAMGVSLYSFRQWWVIPLPQSLIKFGATNTVTIASGKAAPVTIFGDYRSSEQTRSCLPSLQVASWTKAFCTYDHYDSRIYETVSPAKVHSSYRANKGWVDDDLSSEAGRQFGQYRIHLIAVPGDGNNKLKPTAHDNSWRSPYLLASMDSQHLISGANPYSMRLATKDIVLPIETSPQPKDFELKCQLTSPGGKGSAFIGVEFQGKDFEGASKKWTSIWQPALITTDRSWAPFYLSDSLPEKVLRLHDLRVSITVCPFHPELLILHQKQAIKGKVLVKNLTLTLCPG
jgi:hypothetical protein